MRLAVVAYPVVSDRDRRWLEELRAAHDPQAKLLAAHFTLVFPMEAAASDVVEHTETVLRDFRAISFALREARVVRDLVGHAGAHVFLVPGQGADEIIRLHDRLYMGLLRPYLRPELPFVPHVTVAASRDIRKCEQLAARLNQQHLDISGQVTAADIIEGDAEVRTVARLNLGA